MQLKKKAKEVVLAQTCKRKGLGLLVVDLKEKCCPASYLLLFFPALCSYNPQPQEYSSLLPLLLAAYNLGDLIIDAHSRVILDSSVS